MVSLRKKLGDLLVERGYITRKQIEGALERQASTGKRLGALLIEEGLINEEQLIDTISERLSIPKVSLKAMIIDPLIVQRVPVEIARRYTLIPIFAIGNTLTLAMSDPLNIIAIDEIKYRTGSEIKRAVASSKEIKEAIDQYYSIADSIHGIIGDSEDLPEALISSSAAENIEADTPVVKLVNLLISKAVKDRASDIHIEPDERKLRIRYRIHGVMREEASPPKSMQQEVISRIKVSSNLDVSERRLPQDGRFVMVVDGAPIDLRVSTLPTIHGEKIVIRILDRRNLLMSFEELGFHESLIDAWKNVINKPEGLILISGPTSSGKTSTLYASLLDINSIEKNIITVEDPVEFSLPLINQIQINEKAGLNYPTTLRSILRQSPDVIMIGEIRDTETAKMAIRSSLTGHIVFSTIHTNDAASAITRLLDIGVEGYLLAAGLKGVLAQRLVRVNCSHCLESYQPAAAMIRRAGLHEISKTIEFMRGKGCTKCRKTGFKGLVGIFEYISITAEIAEKIIENASLPVIRNLARQSGYVPLFEAGREKMKDGVICLEELLRETSNIEDYFNPQHSLTEKSLHVGTI